MNLINPDCLTIEIMNAKPFIAIVVAIFILNNMACKRMDDRDTIVYNMLISKVQSSDTINDLEIDWVWKRRVVNSDLYNVDIEALNKKVSLILDSIQNHTAHNVEMAIWNILGDDDICDMFDIFKCWVSYGKYHWVCRPVHNAFAHYGGIELTVKLWHVDFM